MGTLIASLISLAPTLIGPTIRAVEALFGPKTGATKMEAVVEALRPVLEKAATAGKIPGIPDDVTLRTIIESVFQKDKADIEAVAPVAPKLSNCIQVPVGSTITIQFPPDTKADI